MSCQGLSNQTRNFAKYSLEELNKEVQEMVLIGENVSLPKYVGGANVGLLISEEH